MRNIYSILFVHLFLGINCFFAIAEDVSSLRDRYIKLLEMKGFNDNDVVDDISIRDAYIELLEQSVLGNETMISRERLDSLLKCMQEVEQNNIPGDFIETGVWRGGATIFMKGFLTAYDNRARKVWVADSFQGFPATTRHNELRCNNQNFPHLVVSLDTVKENFTKYDLLDDQVSFLKGFFSDTLPNAPIEKLSLLRLDGDLYQSTMDALNYLYPKLSIGGYILIDDYGFWPGCADAVNDYRNAHNIDEKIFWEDDTGIHWKKAHE